MFKEKTLGESEGVADWMSKVLGEDYGMQVSMRVCGVCGKRMRRAQDEHDKCESAVHDAYCGRVRKTQDGFRACLEEAEKRLRANIAEDT